MIQHMTLLEAWMNASWVDLAQRFNADARSLLTTEDRCDQGLWVVLLFDPGPYHSRRVTGQVDVNDGSVTAALLDIDSTGRPVSLELILSGELPPCSP